MEQIAEIWGMQGTLYVRVNTKAAADPQMQEPGNHFTMETVSSLFVIKLTLAS